MCPDRPGITECQYIEKGLAQTCNQQFPGLEKIVKFSHSCLFMEHRYFLLQSIINKPRRERRRNSETLLSLSSLIEFVLNESAIKIEI